MLVHHDATGGPGKKRRGTGDIYRSLNLERVGMASKGLKSVPTWRAWKMANLYLF